VAVLKLERGFAHAISHVSAINLSDCGDSAAENSYS
jgi:hypothetical protein